MTSEECLVFLKPDAIFRRKIGASILQEFLNNRDMSILAFQEVPVSEELAEKHYQEHEGKFFFPWLLKSICAAPVLAMIVQGDIQAMRTFLGATFVQKADPNTIRGKYGIWGGVNSVHCSDSPETGANEVELWENLADLRRDSNAIKNIKAYIKKWSKYSCANSTLELRELCRALSEGSDSEDQVNDQIIALLKKDCPQLDEETIRTFADIIIENILL